MDTFEDLIMDVYKKCIEQGAGPSAWVPYRRHEAGKLMELARRVSDSPLSGNSSVLWAIGSVYALSRSVCQVNSYQNSIKLQAMIQNSSPAQTSQVINALLPYIADLSFHKYGNFVVQAAIARATANQFAEICTLFENLWGHMGCDNCGSWVLFAVMERASKPQRQAIFRELAQHAEAGGRLHQKIRSMLTA